MRAGRLPRHRTAFRCLVVLDRELKPATRDKHARFTRAILPMEVYTAFENERGAERDVSAINRGNAIINHISTALVVVFTKAQIHTIYGVPGPEVQRMLTEVFGSVGPECSEDCLSCQGRKHSNRERDRRLCRGVVAWACLTELRGLYL